MGLLLCLSAAPWGGAEIDEVNRVGRALRDKVGDDNAWFEEWARMGDIVEARGRDAAEEGPHVDRRGLPDARRALLPDRRALSAARPALAGGLQESGEVVRRRRGDAEAPAHRVGGDSLRRQENAGAVRPSGAGGGRQQARAGDGVLRRLRHHQGDPIFQGRARSRGARHRLSDRRRTRQRRERALPRSAADRRDGEIRHRGLRISGGAEGGRCQAHRRDGDQPRWLLRAARGLARAALCRLHRLGRAVGLLRHLEEALRSAWTAARCRRCRCRRST